MKSPGLAGVKVGLNSFCVKEGEQEIVGSPGVSKKPWAAAVGGRTWVGYALVLIARCATLKGGRWG
jgi:hypothetical protein